ncbi:MAG: hypothetical protein FWH37_02255 [Candidatus Bathyarchaeota archaeon]|nr:hypothetical protein [Candidatus Termiticorpusculum sp.]
MQIKTLVIELVILLASVLVFRSTWMILDQYFGSEYVEILLAVGIIVTILGLISMKREMNKNPENEKEQRPNI